MSRVHHCGLQQTTLRVDARLSLKPGAPSKPWPFHLHHPLGALAIAYPSGRAWAMVQPMPLGGDEVPASQPTGPDPTAPDLLVGWRGR